MKRQLLLKMLLMALGFITALQVGAYDFEKDGIYYTISGSNAHVTYKNTNYNSYSGTVNIPATVTYNGTTYNVSTIGPSAFQNCSSLRRVVIPNSVQYISNYAFKNCSILTNITIPASVYTIYNNVFEGCTFLKSVICLNSSARPWPTNNFSQSTYENATLIVPQGCKTAYQSSSDCWGEFDHIVEMDCDFVEDAIFYDDLGGNKARVTHAYHYIEDYSGDIVIPQTVTHNRATYTVTAVDEDAFYYGHYLSSLSLPATVNAIGSYAFYDCTYLTSINIPEGVEYINFCTFGGCNYLPEITIPSSVTWIAQNAFVNCTSLANITCRATTPPICVDSSCFPSQAYSNATLKVPSASLSDYQNTDIWDRFTNIVGQSYDFEVNGIYYIITGPNTASVTYKDTDFNSYSGNVTIPSTVRHDGNSYTVTAIGRSAFRASTGLTGISIPNTVTTIDYSAFYNCTSLTAVNIPNSVTTLGEFCFMSCEALQTVTIGSGVTCIPRQCFLRCEALTQITIPSTVKEISYYAFDGCYSLTSVTIQNGVETIRYGAFADCPELPTFTIPASVKTIEETILSSCTSLSSINVNSANTHYRSQNGVLFTAAMDSLIAFPNMSTTAYQIPEGVKVIGAEAFMFCNNLHSVTLPEGLTTISSSAFAYCENLTAFDIPASVSMIGNAALGECTSLASINVAEGNQHYMTDYGVLYTIDGKIIIQYPCARPDKHYSILNTCDSVGYLSFAQASQLKSVYVPAGIKTLEQHTFQGSTVERVVIDEGLKTIAMNAFAGCSHLKSIYLPSTLTKIENLAFQMNLEMEEITFAGSTPPTIGNNAFYGVGYDTENLTLYVPAGAGSNYSSHNWQSNYFEFSVAEISPVASGTEFTVDSLNYVTTDASLNAKVSGVTSKNIVDPGIPPKVAYQGNLCTVTTLADHALANCTKMVRAEVPFSVSLIDSYAFYSSTNIETLRLHEGVQRIGSFSMSHINKIETLTIPASVDSISGTFVNYSGKLREILVNPDNTKYRSNDGVLFSKDRKLLVAFPGGKGSSYTIPHGTVNIGSSSFRGTSLLQELEMPTSLRVIEGSAFFECTSLESIDVPNGVTTIGNNAFSHCSSVISADLPKTLTELGYNAFYNVPDLTNLVVRATTPPTCKTYINPRTHEVSEPFINDHYTNVNLIVPPGCAQAYREASIWKKFQHITETGFPEEFTRGDVNKDNAVNIADVTALIDYLLGGDASTISLGAADVNQDGAVNIADVTALIDYLLSGSWPGDAAIDMWYLIGDRVGSSPWENQGEGSIGRGLIPLYPVGEFGNDGLGQLSYTGFFGAEDAVMLIHHPGSNDDCWGRKPNGVFGRGGEEITGIAPGNDGYYTLIANTKNSRFYFIPYSSTTPITFNTINIPGNHSGWDVSDPAYNMTPLNPSKENHNWIFRNFTVATDGELKFAANNGWTYNWGVIAFPFGHGEQDGYNIPVEAGTYDVYFNDITGDFNFIKK